MKYIWWIFLAIIFIVVIAFSVLNSQSVMLYYFIGKANLPLSVAIVGAFIIGGLLGLVIGRCKNKSCSKV